jgi:hypothetical protein
MCVVRACAFARWDSLLACTCACAYVCACLCVSCMHAFSVCMCVCLCRTFARVLGFVHEHVCMHVLVCMRVL